MSRKFWLFKSFLIALLTLTNTTFASLWEPPLEVSDTVSRTTIEPVIVADFQDNAAMAWVSESGEEVYSSYRPFGGAWETPTFHGKGFQFDICMDEAGNVTLAFISGNPNSRILTAFRPYGSGWATTAEEVASVIDSASFASDVSLSCTSTNFYGYVSWFDNQQVAGTPLIRTLFRRNAGSGTGATGWELTPVDVNNPATHAAETSSNGIIKVHSDGNATIVAKYNAPATEDFYSSSTTSPGGAYTTPVQLLFAAFGSPELFDFDMTTNGNAIVGTSLAGSPRVRTTTDTLTWGGSGVQTVTPANPTANPSSVGVDQNGLGTIVFSTTADEVQIAHDVMDGITWTPSTITTATTTVNRPLVHVSSNGFRIVAWDEGTGDPSNLIALRGQNTTLESTSSVIDSEIRSKSANIFITTTSRGFAAWNDFSTTQFAEASRTYEPPSPSSLLQALGKKRLIYQQTRYP